LAFFERLVLQLKLILFKYFFLVSLLHATITSSADILRVATSTKEKKFVKKRPILKEMFSKEKLAERLPNFSLLLLITES